MLELIQKERQYLKSTDHGVALWRNQLIRQAGQVGNATFVSSSVWITPISVSRESRPTLASIQKEFRLPQPENSEHNVPKGQTMKRSNLTAGVLLAVIAATNVRAQQETDDVALHEHHSHIHDNDEPVGVMGAHIHEAGEWMLSYRYMFMEMDGNRDGNTGLSEQDVFAQGFMVTPTRMTMEMHMLGAMYAFTDDFTLMSMLPYVRISMDHRTRAGGEFTTQSEGIGDVRLAGMYVLRRWARQQVHLNAGIGLPTGSVQEKDDTPAGSNQKLPYPMQLGSGTFDLLPGITYLGQADDWSWGSKLDGTFRLGTNDEGYTLGNRIALTVWGAKKWANWVSTSLRLNGQSWGNIDGQDDDLNPAMVPTADPDRRGGERIDLSLGVNLYGREGRVKDHRLGVEVGTPIYQSLDGPQLETDWMLTVGWQYAW
ncbi:MAG: transporter [Planctomycetota bacterium]|nr:transporter [Planctomycetota bacterium]